VAGDILDYRDLLVADDRLEYDPTAFDKGLGRPEATVLLERLRARLAVADFSAPALEQLVQQFIIAEGIKPAQIVHALRVALTGKAVGFGLYETMAILGRPGALARIDRALERARSGK
jgi:glutamyl-tRNA synthetase